MRSHWSSVVYRIDGEIVILPQSIPSELKIEPNTFHGDWNYAIRPRPIAP